MAGKCLFTTTCG